MKSYSIKNGELIETPGGEYVKRDDAMRALGVYRAANGLVVTFSDRLRELANYIDRLDMEVQDYESKVRQPD